MSAQWWLANLAAWSAQVAVLVTAGSLLPLLFRLCSPRVLLVYRQWLLAVCLLLPAVEPWKPAMDGVEVTVSTSVAVPAPASRPPRRWWPGAGTILLVLMAGTGVRILWLAVGFHRLTSRRRRAHLLEPRPAWLETWQARLGVQPRIYVSSEVSSPVTFGAIRPVILLPEPFLELQPPVQEAIACHELLHVRRRDWAFTVGEEIVRAVLWFHPVVWWLLGQIQLNREQTVDHAAVRLIEDRGRYLDALLAVAGARTQPNVVPAPLFLRKRHLAQRVALILREVPMSQSRLFSSLAGTASLVACAGWLAILQFPLRAPAQELSAGPAILKGGDHLLHRAPIQYPAEALEKRVEGTVLLHVTLNERGVVSDARVISGPEMLRKAALKSVLEWHYSPSAGLPSTAEVAVEFRLPAPTPEVGQADRRAAARKLEMQRVMAPTGRQPLAVEVAAGGVLKRIEFVGVSETAREALLRRLPVREGDTIQPDTFAAVKQAVQEVDEHLAMQVRMEQAKGSQPETVLRITYLGSPPPAGTSPSRIRVGRSVQAAQIASKVNPVYPPLAKQARIQGLVRLQVIVSAEGEVREIEAVSGHPLLVPAAMEAVRQWVYKPTFLDGKAVEVISDVEVNFTLLE